MGTFKTPDEMGHKSSLNGHDELYGAAHWRDNMVGKRTSATGRKKAVIVFCIDLFMIIALLGIINKIDTAKELLAWIVGFLYVATRTTIQIIKLLSFIGKNKEWIRKGKNELIDLIKKPE